MLLPRLPRARVGMTPEEQAKAFFTSGMDEVKKAAIRAALDQLHGWGITDEQIKVVVDASGKTPDQIAAMGKDAAIKMLSDARTLAEGYVKAKINEEAVAAMEGLGFSKAEAQALAATGGSKEKLLALGKDRLKELSSDLNARLKKEGFDLVGMAGKGLGFSEKDFGALAKGATAAYDVYNTFATAIGGLTGSARAYSMKQWSPEFFTDDSLRGLTHALAEIGAESDTQRRAQSAKNRAVMKSLAEAAAKAASAIPVYGWVAAAAIEGIAEAATAFGLLDSKAADDNSSDYTHAAGESAGKLWEKFKFSPPAYSSSEYTAKSYGETLDYQLGLLQEAEDETPFASAWQEVATWAAHQWGDTADPAVQGLINHAWFPLQYAEWMGGALAPSISNLSRSIDGALRFFPGNLSPKEGPASVGAIYPADWDLLVYRLMPGLMRERMNGWRDDPSYVIRSTPGGHWYSGIGQSSGDKAEEAKYWTVPPPSSAYARPTMEEWWPSAGHLIAVTPRSAVMQQMIRDRMAATVGTMVGAYERWKRGTDVSLESVIEAAVKRGREWIEQTDADGTKYGFRPEYSAKTFRDVFLAAQAVAGPKVIKRSDTPVSGMGDAFTVARSLRAFR